MQVYIREVKLHKTKLYCIIYLTQVSGYPGERISFGVEVVDELKLSTVAVYRLSTKKTEDVMRNEV